MRKGRTFRIFQRTLHLTDIPLSLNILLAILCLLSPPKEFSLALSPGSPSLLSSFQPRPSWVTHGILLPAFPAGSLSSSACPGPAAKGTVCWADSSSAASQGPSPLERQVVIHTRLPFHSICFSCFLVFQIFFFFCVLHLLHFLSEITKYFCSL